MEDSLIEIQKIQKDHVLRILPVLLRKDEQFRQKVSIILDKVTKKCQQKLEKKIDKKTNKILK